MQDRHFSILRNSGRFRLSKGSSCGAPTRRRVSSFSFFYRLRLFYSTNKPNLWLSWHTSRPCRYNSKLQSGGISAWPIPNTCPPELQYRKINKWYSTRRKKKCSKTWVIRNIIARFTFLYFTKLWAIKIFGSSCGAPTHRRTSSFF